ncbi:MAG: hypothetical protein U1C49_00940 [Candidatus Andersenbacteria bacterium]|nr:hypothetical protein [bacterium]MDZ4225392.1 hypothetical protein [Candidatus Andersenbacteria bacterium]
MNLLFSFDPASTVSALGGTLARPSGRAASTESLPPRQYFCFAKNRRGPCRQSFRRPARADTVLAVAVIVCINVSTPLMLGEERRRIKNYPALCGVIFFYRRINYAVGVSPSSSGVSGVMGSAGASGMASAGVSGAIGVSGVIGSSVGFMVSSFTEITSLKIVVYKLIVL